MDQSRGLRKQTNCEAYLQNLIMAPSSILKKQAEMSENRGNFVSIINQLGLVYVVETAANSCVVLQVS